uniref:AlNc14C243G9506 protein n=1 Tax=Albugo laibachii Nc14 TaxID=890382 RepID=F0WT20_9STRA|nr:AlNc14C243G9506 [Albugo laibachii Nc14]|eukprot:CCA24506.1 AlNc14C243G9506 [Albugo laibachii Nc14]
MSVSPPLNASRVVASLLSTHLNLKTKNEFSIGSLRDLYALPFLRSNSEKRSLLQHAANTHCAAVMMDALLFSHHTMQENSYFDAMNQYPDLKSLWLQSTCIQEEQLIRTLDLETRGNS